MTNVLIVLAVLLFAVVLALLNRFVKKAQAEQMARRWNERERWRDPTARRRSSRHSRGR